MDIDALIRVALSDGVDKLFSEAWPRLKPGDQLRLRVIAVQDDQRAWVDFGRFRALAEVSFPVVAGDELAVRVIDTRGQIRLEVIRPPLDLGGMSPAQWKEPARPFSEAALKSVREDLDRLLAAVSRSSKAGRPLADLLHPLEGLRMFLEPLPLEFGGQASASRVQSLCENSGLFFEKRLEAGLDPASPRVDSAGPESASDPAPVKRLLAADLKARLAEIKSVLAQAAADQAIGGGREGAALSRSVDALLNEIVQHQKEMVRRADGAESVQVVHFTLPLPESDGKARLKIGFPRRRPARPAGGFRAALLLEFDRLGELRADLFMLDRNLTVGIFVRQAEMQAVLEAHLPEIHAALAPLFDHVQINVSVSAKKVADFEWEDLQPETAGRLDVRI